MLNSIRFQTAMYGIIDCGAPWGLELPPEANHFRLLMGIRGGALVQLGGSHGALSLGAGEILLARNQFPWQLKDAPATPTKIDQHLTAAPMSGQRIVVGGAGCGMVNSIRQRAKQRILRPALQYETTQHQRRLRAQVQAEPGLESLIRVLISELSGSVPGGEVLVNWLSDAIFVQIVRAYANAANACSQTPSWFKALHDPQIGTALKLIHEKPRAPWTVASLAEALNMSRTSFATRFTAVMEKTPIDYLTEWRMQKAIALLRDTHNSIDQISHMVGYASRAAFAKAFKKEVGHSPAEYRDTLLMSASA